MSDPTADKALVASSEFDPTAFLNGMDAMTASLTNLSAQEDELRKKLADQTKALADNKAAMAANQAQVTALDKSSASYQASLAKLTDQGKALTSQQKDLQGGIATTQGQLKTVTDQAGTYKDALSNITAVAKAAGQAGSNLFDVGSINAKVQEITASAGELRDIFQGKLDTGELDDLEAKLASTGDEMGRLKEVVDFVQEHLNKLDPNTKGFEDLTKVVETGNEVLSEFAKVQENVAGRTETVRSRLRELRTEMQNLQAAGKQDTDEFRAMQKEAAELQDAVDKTGERIKTFSNDTRGIEGAVEAIRGIAAGFELAEGASALFGLKNEAVEESIKRLNAIMAIANGLQEISNLLKKESTLRLVGEEVATKAYIVTQRVLTATLGTTAAASRGLSTALAATGIGALVIGIGILLNLLSQWADETKELVEAQERLNAVNELGIELTNRFNNAIANNGKLFQAEAEARQAANEKIRVSDIQRLKDKAKNAEELRAIDVKTLQEQVEQTKSEIDKQQEGYDEAQARLHEILEKNQNSRAELLAPLQKTIDDFTKLQDTQFALENALRDKLINNARDAAKDRLDISRAELAAYEDFLKRLQDLQKRLTDARNKQARQDEETLTKAAGDNLQAELLAIDRDIRKGSLTRDRGNILKTVLKQINGVELATELREFHKKSIEAQQSIEDEILNLRITAGEQRAGLLRDQLERDAATIQLESRKEFAKLEQDRTAALTKNQEQLAAGLISPGQFERNAERLKQQYTDLINILAETTTRKSEELARTAFELGKGLLQQMFAESGATISEKTTAQIAALTARYTSGTIRYETYQRRLTAILQTESKKRIDQEIAEANELLAGTQRRLAAEQDPAQRKTLQDQITALREQIAQLQRQKANAEATATKTTDDNFKADVNRIAQYAQAIGSVVDQVVRFWQAANEAEQKSLQHSITLQEQRVDAATRIAERGNAEYLRLEEDRLNELQVKQENAARRQLAINAVLQASQALVAFTSALAQGISTGGPLGGLAIAAAVLGVIASGYSIIQSLQANNNDTQKLKGGVKRVKRNGAPAGTDTVPAMLTENEAVLPVATVDAYEPAVNAIYDRTVSPEEMNAFVQAHPRARRRMAGLAMERIGEATDVNVTYDARLVSAAQETNRQLAETNANLTRVHKRLGDMGFSVNIDKRGIAVALAGVLAEQKLSRKK